MFEEEDLPPEYCHYEDEGCELAKSCLNCPFPQCVYDTPRGKSKWVRSLRDKQIVLLHNTNNFQVKELAERFNVHRNTITRALGKGGEV